MLSYEQDIKNHGEEVAPKEACGLLLRGERRGEVIAQRCENISKTPEDTFEIDVGVTFKAQQSGALIGAYHTHPKTPSVFSQGDIRMSEESMLPYYVYSLVDQKFNIYMPKGHPVNLLGREFAIGIFDCATFVIDYYAQRLNIELPYFPHDLASLQYGHKDFKQYLADNHFVEIMDREDLRRHDVILMSLNGMGTENHAAVYVGDGDIMHQLIKRRSEQTLYLRTYWQKTTVRVYRYSL